MANRLVNLIAAATLVVTAALALVIQLDLRAAPDIVIQSQPELGTIQVAIDGAVESPGVYELPRGSRVHDLLEASGGYLSSLDLSAINQAALLVDGQRVFVPSRETDQSVRLDATPGPLRVDLNSATVDELDLIPGIGPVKAAAIVEYRNMHGPFQTIEELLLVDGISENLLAGIRQYLVIGS